MPKHKIYFIVLIIISSLMIYGRGLNVLGIEYRDDEIFYYRSTQEMLAERNFLSPTYFGEDRFQKPIFFYWLILLSYKIFGISWFAARFPSVICARKLRVVCRWILKFQNHRVSECTRSH